MHTNINMHAWILFYLLLSIDKNNNNIILFALYFILILVLQFFNVKTMLFLNRVE